VRAVRPRAREVDLDREARDGVAFNVIYGTVAVVVSVGTAWRLAQHRAALTTRQRG